MSNTMTMRVSPAVLRWVLESEGWEVDELAGETGLDPERMRRWATVESDVSLRDLKRMSTRFRRPMSVLLMAEAPGTAVPKYRRRGGGPAGARLSRPVLEVVRKARFVQDNAAEMLEAMNGEEAPDVRRAALGQSPESAAAESAAALGIGPPRCTGRGEERDRKRYNMVREKIESRNVFAMQERIPGDGVAGFALADGGPAVILVNWRHSARRRTFALLHEYAHILLNNSGVCPARGGDAGAGDETELWCDRFAGAVLMPMDGFGDALRDAHQRAGGDPLRAVSDLSDRFCVDRAAAAARSARILDDAGLGKRYSRCFIRPRPPRPPFEDDAGLGKRYSRCCAALGQEDMGRKGGGTGGHAGRMGQAASCLARKGRRYARLVAAAAESGDITTSTALDHLEIKLENLDELMMRC